MRTKFITAAVGAAATFSFAQASAATISIDDFNTAVEVVDLVSTPGATTSAGETGPSIFFNSTRTVSIETTAVGPTAGTPAGTVAIGNSIAQFSSNANTEFLASLTYDAQQPRDVSLDGQDQRFQIDFLSGDGSGDFTFSLTDADGNMASVTRTVDAEELGITDFSFSNLVGDDVDLTRITQLAFTVDGTPDLDLTIEFLGITTDPIPLPAAAPLMISALAGFAAFRRKRA